MINQSQNDLKDEDYTKKLITRIKRDSQSRKPENEVDRQYARYLQLSKFKDLSEFEKSSIVTICNILI